MTLEPYPDGRWWPVEHRVSPRFPLVGRGNVGEVYPNVVAPMTGSILNVPFAEGMQAAFVEMGFATTKQAAEFDGRTTAMTANFGGYLYGNVSLARSMAVRTPGMTTDVIDRQMFGLTDAPAHRNGPGDRSPAAAARSLRAIARGVLRPDRSRIERDRLAVDRQIASGPRDRATATDAELLAVATGSGPLCSQLMTSLMVAGALAAVSRTMLERLVAPQGGDGLVNDLTAGLGTIESAAPAVELWRMSRIDDDAEFETALSGFVERHGSRGPNEWELAAPTWGTDPSIAIAAIDRLRSSPDDHDPTAVGRRLGARREELAPAVRARLRPYQRRAFDLALRGTALYQADREANKAAFVRHLHAVRLALTELARRSAFDHDDFFLLMIDEVEPARDEPERYVDVVAERRERRDYLQARIPPYWFEGTMPSPTTWPLRVDQRRIDPTARTLQGLGVCSGSVTGRARIVTDPAAPGDLGPGDILVAPITDPAWTPLFLAADGVVVDVGAQMSHAAIVARELGIPAVVSATGASTTIPDGALVTVDGSTGTVVVH